MKTPDKDKPNPKCAEQERLDQEIKNTRSLNWDTSSDWEAPEIKLKQ